jgi:mannose-1-phosphate guanylyltransferase
MLYAVVLAGGSGTRLWPRSRSQTPKHLLNLLRPERTMLQETVSRVLPAVEPDRVLVVTNARHADEVRAQLPEVPPANVLAEPMGRNSGPAVGYGAIHVHKRDPEGVMLVLPADHVILEEGAFRSAVAAAARVARKGYLVTLGINPGYPDTGYGYMELGEELERAEGHEVRRVVRFTEKPDLERATEYVRSGRYVWNSGMFVWRAETILQEIGRHMPELRAHLARLEPSLGTEREAAEAGRVWPSLEDKSIDYGVLERSDRVVTLPVDIGWNDVGDWAALAEHSPRDTDGNAVVGDAMVFDSRNSLVYSSGRLVTAIGLEDMIVVDTGDAVLVCPKARAQEVRRVVDRLKSEGRHEQL